MILNLGATVAVRQFDGIFGKYLVTPPILMSSFTKGKYYYRLLQYLTKNVLTLPLEYYSHSTNSCLFSQDCGTFKKKNLLYRLRLFSREKYYYLLSAVTPKTSGESTTAFFMLATKITCSAVRGLFQPGRFLRAPQTQCNATAILLYFSYTTLFFHRIIITLRVKNPNLGPTIALLHYFNTTSTISLLPSFGILWCFCNSLSNNIIAKGLY
jgi:hypothetical protein